MIVFTLKGLERIAATKHGNVGMLAWAAISVDFEVRWRSLARSWYKRVDGLFSIHVIVVKWKVARADAVRISTSGRAGQMWQWWEAMSEPKVGILVW